MSIVLGSRRGHPVPVSRTEGLPDAKRKKVIASLPPSVVETTPVATPSATKNVDPPHLILGKIAIPVAEDSFYVPGFFGMQEGVSLYSALRREFAPLYMPRSHPALQFKVWKDGVSKIYPFPRDKLFLGDVKGDLAPQYRYNAPGDDLYPSVAPWTKTAAIIREKLLPFQDCNHMVGNQYRNGLDHISFHHDKSRDFVEGSSVLTVSFGHPRRFVLQNVETNVKIELMLTSGSLFVLGPKTNLNWKHAIMKQTSKKAEIAPRISLTYRSIKRTINQKTGRVVLKVEDPVVEEEEAVLHKHTHTHTHTYLDKDSNEVQAQILEHTHTFVFKKDM